MTVDTATDENSDARARQRLIASVAASPLAEEIEPQAVVGEVTLAPPSASGATYRIIITDEMDPYDKPTASLAMFSTTLETLRVFGDDFSGKSRRSAKLSIASGPIEDFPDLHEMINTLPTITQMVHHNPPVTKVWNSKRVVEEQRNARLRVWLYAASREDDNDFHLILGRAPGLTPRIYMTMELSGLPPTDSPHFARLKGARDSFKHFFGNMMPGATYQHYDPPIPVEIEGSLFFDITHSSGPHPGPQKLRDNMPTIWEVHPISRIVFEP